MKLLSSLFLLLIPFVSYTQTMEEFCSRKEKEVFPLSIKEKIMKKGVGVENRAMVVRFGKKGCIPCKAEMQTFTQIAAMNKHVVFVYFSEDKEDIQVYKEVESANLLFLQLDYDSVADSKLTFGYPTTYWVERDGGILKVTVGGTTDKEMLTQVSQQWQQLIDLLE